MLGIGHSGVRRIKRLTRGEGKKIKKIRRSKGVLKNHLLLIF